MKTTRYNFEKTVQDAKLSNIDWLKQEFRTILESDKDFTRKADYLGYSILSIDNKCLAIDEEINELKELKANLKTAKELVLITGAEVFKEYGIEKIEGAGISSLSIAKPTIKTKTVITPQNIDLLIESGFYKKVLDLDALTNAYEYNNYTALIEKSCKVEKITTTSEAKLRVNKRRKSANNEIEELLQIEQAS